MADAPKNPSAERAARIPFEKDDVMPLPQVTRLPRAADGSAPDTVGSDHAQGKEEYPGPRTSSSGERSEPGSVKEGDAVEPDGPDRAQGASHGRS
jgi:hypothetical protein